MKLKEFIFGKPKENKRSEMSGGELSQIIMQLSNDIAVTETEAIQISAVARCVNIISSAAGMLPIKLYRKAERGTEEITDDPRLRILNGDTGDTLNATEMRIKWVRDYLLTGRAYGYITRRNGKADGIYYVDPKNVAVMSDTDPIFKKYTLYVNGKAYHPDYFLKILRHTDGKGHGVGIVEENRELLATAYVTMKLEKAFAKNGGNKRGFLQAKNHIGDAAIKALKADWRALYNGEENAAVLNDGVEFKESSNTAAEMQIDERTRAIANSIMAVFGTNDGILSDETIRNAVLPVLDVFEAAFDSQLLLEREKDSCYFAFDTRELTRGNLLERYNAYAVALQNNFLQLDDVRALEDMPPIGFNFIKLGLQDVLLNPKTGEIYTPNTNAAANLNGMNISDTEIAESEERGYNPDQPRDEYGRWTGSGGGGSSKKVKKSGLTKYKNRVRIDSNGKPFKYKTHRLPPKEYANVCDEIGRNYHSNFEGKPLCRLKFTNKVYFFENRGIGDYNIYSVKKAGK